jgi:NAD(P)H-dependent FMN reductase
MCPGPETMIYSREKGYTMTGHTVLGVSGSPVKNSNTDTLVRVICEASGGNSEFVKLSDIMVGPCNACMKCTFTNECVIQDDFVWLSKAVMDADALVIGSPTYYGAPSAFMKAFLERLFSKRHIHLRLKGKLAATAAVGEVGDDAVSEWLSMVLTRQGLDVVGSMTAKGTPCCFACGAGETCAFSTWNAVAEGITGVDYGYAEAYAGYLEILPDNVPLVHGSSKILRCRSVSDEPAVIAEAERIGKEIEKRLKS